MISNDQKISSSSSPSTSIASLKLNDSIDIPDEYYINIEEYSEELIEFPEKYNFSSSQFSKYFEFHQDYNYNLKLMRRFIQSQTNLIFKQSYYNLINNENNNENQNENNLINNENNSKNKIIKIDKNEIIQSAKNVKYYSDSSFLKLQLPINKIINNKNITKIKVIEGDCLECAINLIKNSKNTNIALLNMSSAKRPGGGYREGAGAQEENLFRRTSLVYTLEDIEEYDNERKWSYPIIDKVGGIYVPNVKVIRGSEQDGYPLLDQIYNLNIICVPAFRTPKLDHTGLKIDSKEIIDLIRKRIKLMLAMAYHNNNKILILSAWGCGAYRNPPQHIAQLFEQTIIEYDGLFDEIIFAIYNDKNAERNGKQGNVQPFKDQFKKYL